MKMSNLEENVVSVPLRVACLHHLVLDKPYIKHKGVKTVQCNKKRAGRTVRSSEESCVTVW